MISSKNYQSNAPTDPLAPNAYAAMHSRGGYASMEGERFSTFNDYPADGGDIGVMQSMKVRYGDLATDMVSLKKIDLSTVTTTTLGTELESDPRAGRNRKNSRNPVTDRLYFRYTLESNEKQNAIKKIDKWE